MEDVQISPNFKLSQLTKSARAQRSNFPEQYTPDEIVIGKLRALCIHLLEPLYASIKRHYPNALFRQTSVYRCPRVNKAEGGADSSQHLFGEASDNELVIEGTEQNLLLAQLVLNEGLEFDQMILEYGPSANKPEWIHLSWDLDKAKQRGQILRITHNEHGEVVSYGMTKNAVLALKYAA